MKNFQQTYTTIEQSKRLLELGLPKDTADMYYSAICFGGMYDKNPSVCATGTFSGYIDLPCWSVGRLIEMFEICFKKEILAEHLWTSIEYCGYPTYTDYLVHLFGKNINAGRIDFSKLED